MRFEQAGQLALCTEHRPIMFSAPDVNLAPGEVVKEVLCIQLSAVALAEQLSQVVVLMHAELMHMAGAGKGTQMGVCVCKCVCACVCVCVCVSVCVCVCVCV